MAPPKISYPKKAKKSENDIIYNENVQAEEFEAFMESHSVNQQNTPKADGSFMGTEQIDELGKFLEKNTDIEDVPEVEERKSTEFIKATTQRDDHDALNKVLLEILSPQLSDNEYQKRFFKQRLMLYILIILSIQLGMIAIPIVCCFLSTCIDVPFIKSMSLSRMELLFGFLKYYITAIIVEFIAMLFFIVKFVFDKSIVDLMKGLLKK